MILKWVLEKYNMVIWTGFILLRMETRGGLRWTLKSSIKCWEILEYLSKWRVVNNGSAPCKFSFHRLLHSHHHLSSRAGNIGQLVADVPSGLSFTPPNEIKKSNKQTNKQTRKANLVCKWIYLVSNRAQWQALLYTKRDITTVLNVNCCVSNAAPRQLCLREQHFDFHNMREGCHHYRTVDKCNSNAILLIYEI
jgi:hypothetical protein